MDNKYRLIQSLHDLVLSATYASIFTNHFAEALFDLKNKKKVIPNPSERKYKRK